MQGLDSGTRAVVDDYDSFMKEKRNIIEMYLAYCKTDAYKSTPAYKMKTLMLEFQKASGYIDVFIANMKILSREYAAYFEKLHNSNDLFMREYPNAADILGYF